MSYGQAGLSSLLHDSTITALTSAYGEGECIFYSHVIPKDVSETATTINYYFETFSGWEEFGKYPYMVNCRAATEAAARALQTAVRDKIHRHGSGGANYLCEVLEVIPPADETDNYNAPVRVIIKER
jgi:hypothetical protein